MKRLNRQWRSLYGVINHPKLLFVGLKKTYGFTIRATWPRVTLATCGLKVTFRLPNGKRFTKDFLKHHKVVSPKYWWVTTQIEAIQSLRKYVHAKLCFAWMARLSKIKKRILIQIKVRKPQLLVKRWPAASRSNTHYVYEDTLWLLTYHIYKPVAI